MSNEQAKKELVEKAEVLRSLLGHVEDMIAIISRFKPIDESISPEYNIKPTGCNHSYRQRDEYFNICIHCGLIKHRREGKF